MGAEITALKAKVKVVADATPNVGTQCVLGDPAGPPVDFGGGNVRDRGQGWMQQRSMDTIFEGIGQYTEERITPRITAVEGRCTALEGRCTALEGRCTALEGRCTALESRCTALENYDQTLKSKINELIGAYNHLRNDYDAGIWPSGAPVVSVLP